MACTKDLTWKPMTGPLDYRSEPDKMVKGSFRMRQNFASDDDGRVGRWGGFSKLFDSLMDYNNADLHDQLLSLLTVPTLAEQVTYLKRLTTSRGGRMLSAGTQSRIYTLNEGSGNWRIIAEGLGGENTRFSSAQVGDIVIFTNNYDTIKSWIVEQDGPVVDVVDAEVIGLNQVARLWAWKGVMFFADVVMDGQRFANRIVWSDFNNPLSLDPSKPESLAGYQDLYDDEIILGGLEYQNAFYIYTTHGIWEMTAVGGDRVFAFKNRYRHTEGANCAQFPNAIIAVGDFHLFATSTEICIWNPFYAAPQIMPWINLADGVIYQNGPKAGCCEEFIAAYNSKRKEVYFSWPSNDATGCQPDKTLIYQMTNKSASTFDVGFSALVDYVPFTTGSIRDFIVENCICTLTELNAEGYGYVKEGLPKNAIAPNCDFVPQSIYTSQALDLGGGVIVEDYTKAEADSDSLCALLDGQKFDDICAHCNDQALFVGVWTVDNTLKQIDGSGYRETWNGVDYTLAGFDSIFRGAPVFSLDGTIRLSLAECEFIAEAQSPPSNLNLRVGRSAQCGDPNTDVCGILWAVQTTRPFACMSVQTAAQYAALKQRPPLGAKWNIFGEGEFVYWELKLDGTGGIGTISKFSMSGSEHLRCKY